MNQFIPKSADRIFGTIDSKNDTYKFIIYGYTGNDIYPFLYSYDNDGNVKDSLSLMLTGCGSADETAIPHSRVFIDKELMILLTDTSLLIHFPGYWKKTDKLANGIDSVWVTTGDYVIDSLRISRDIFKVNNEGKFVKQ